MREIKFRGIQHDGYFEDGTRRGNTWIYGNSIEFSYGRAYIKDEETNGWFQVYPETVGWYIGRRDINDIEIYEGDIIKLGNGDICVIKHFTEDGCSMFIAEPINNKHVDRYEWFSTAEVIGNIYDNPELIKVK